MILDHTHHGMRIFPTSLTAALLLQHSTTGLGRSELTHTPFFFLSSISSLPLLLTGEMMPKLEWLRGQVLLRGAKIHWEGGI